MALLDQTRSAIKQQYISFFEIISFLRNQSPNDKPCEIGQYLENIEIAGKLKQYESDRSLRISEKSMLYSETRLQDLVNNLMSINVFASDNEVESAINELQLKYERSYVLRSDFLGFKPIAELDNNTQNESNSMSPPDHIRKLSLSDFFTVVQAACLISNDEAGQIQALIDSGDLRYDSWNYGDHTQAVETIKKGIKAKKLIQDADGDIPRASLQKFLFDKNHIIDGFNDKFSSQDQSTFGTPSVQQNEPNFDNLNTEITQLKDQLAQAQQLIQELEAMSNIQDSDSDAQITGIYRRNLLAKDRQGMARIIALNLWNDDQNILIGDMANRVYAIMVDFCKDDLPQETSSLKTWLRPIAPPESQRKGRKKSNT
ncbi:hypothetical protein MKI79_06890 [Acinetobacter sp. A3.8]|uniref:Uncharacterized protein n=1 Tax=Acinetobacter sedimenti TaxID=2919922 RepID=A0A9X1WXW3_9GAMM|nr:hypothetical protein [Acinetobacter sedimenti]MCJ8146628.1 hypothetical protein [Acinetobacter sedimenti]